MRNRAPCGLRRPLRLLDRIHHLQSSIEMGGFKTFQQCQEAAIGRLRSLDDPDQGDYECGYRCKWRQDMGLNVCKETRQ